MNIYKFISSRSKDRNKLLINVSKKIADSIMNSINTDLEKDEFCYVLGLAINSIINSDASLLKEFTDMYNQITLISDKNKQN